MRRGARTTLAALAAAATGLGAPALAAPGTAGDGALTCGALAAGTVVLTADLVCPDSEVGLELGPHSTLDLNGFRIVGGGSGVGVLGPHHTDTTVTGGVIRGWQHGIAPKYVPPPHLDRADLYVEGVTLRDNDAAVDMPSAASGKGNTAMRVRVTESRFVGNRLGLRVADLWGNVDDPAVRITSSRFVDNDSGVEVAATATVVADTVFARNGVGLTCEESRCPLTDSTLRDNGTAVHSHHYGRLEVARSTFARNDVALDVYWEQAVPHQVIDSAFRDNGTAIRLLDSVGYVSGNTFVRNGVGFQAANDDWPELTVTLVGNEFRRNGDGILSVTEGSEVGDNTAVRNERWGIHAPGAVDLGGNTARGNGNEPQCVGVVCAASGPTS